MYRFYWLAVVLLAPIAGVGVILFSALGAGHRPARKLAAEAVATRGLRPHAHVEAPIYNFGILDPNRDSEHVFVIRNTGKSALELKLGGTTCQCTSCEVPREPIPPGGQAEIVFRWRTNDLYQIFSQRATIHTNDPEQPTLRVHVEGIVRSYLAVTGELDTDGRSTVLVRAYPERESVSRTLLYSQIWDDFEVLGGSCSIEGVTWELLPPPERDMRRAGASSGHLVQITFPAGMPIGEVAGTLTLQARRAGGEVRDIEIPLAGKVVGRVAVYGDAVDSQGRVRLGILRPSEGGQVELTMKVRDPEAHLEVLETKVQPEFVEAVVEPSGEPGSGVYRIQVRVPPGSPLCSHQGSRHGELSVRFNHPRIDQLQLKLDFAVRRAEQWVGPSN